MRRVTMGQFSTTGARAVRKPSKRGLSWAANKVLLLKNFFFTYLLAPSLNCGLWTLGCGMWDLIFPVRVLCVLSRFSHVRLFVTPWTVARQALTMGFSRQEYWSGLLCPPPGKLPNPGIKPPSLPSPALAGGFFTTSATPGQGSKPGPLTGSITGLPGKSQGSAS